MNRNGLSSLIVWAVIFLIIALVTGAFGFGLISGTSFVIAKWLAIIFVILFIISIIAHAVKRA